MNLGTLPFLAIFTPVFVGAFTLLGGTFTQSRDDDARQQSPKTLPLITLQSETSTAATHHSESSTETTNDARREKPANNSPPAKPAFPTQTDDAMIARMIVEENKAWIVARDSKGEIVTDSAGKPMLSPAGERYRTYVAEANKRGIKGSKATHEWAMSALKTELEQMKDNVASLAKMFVDENESWIFLRDSSGAIARDSTGNRKLSSAGNRYECYVALAENRPIASGSLTQPQPAFIRFVEELRGTLYVQQMGGRIERDNLCIGKPAIVVDLQGKEVTDDGLRILGALKRLKVLRLANAKIRDTGLKELASLQELEALDLSQTPVTDVGLRELAALESLKSLGCDRHRSGSFRQS